MQVAGRKDIGLPIMYLVKKNLNPEHDIFVFGNVAVKRIKEGVNSYLVSRVERIESIKDGTEVF